MLAFRKIYKEFTVKNWSSLFYSLYKFILLHHFRSSLYKYINLKQCSLIVYPLVSTLLCCDATLKCSSTVRFSSTPSVHKTVNFNYLCTFDLYSPVHNVLDACKYITRGSGRGWTLEFSSFLGPVKWHRADRRVPFGVKKTRGFQGPTPPPFPK